MCNKYRKYNKCRGKAGNKGYGSKKGMAAYVRGSQQACRLICVFILMAIMLAGCGASDRALMLTGEGTAESGIGLDPGGNGTEGNAGSDYSGNGTAGSMLQDNGSSGAAGAAAQDTAPGSAVSDPQTILVYVCGAVVDPGVVELPAGSRAADALEAAGGLLASAQSDYVNLAARLEDAQKLYFPTREEAEELVQEEAAAARGLVNINTADEEQLCTLPGIGEARARDIIAYREQYGAFQSGEDIMKVSGIKQNAYEKLKDQITVE